MSAARAGARPVYLTPFGLYSRYMLGAYLRHTMMVSAALMTMALTIDLWPQVALFTGDPLQVVFGMAWLAVLRLPDLLPPFMPFATFLGVVWSESAFTESRERLLIWNSGRSPLFCLMPALLAGLVMGVVLFALDAWLRPAAIHVQIAERLGREGIRLDRSQSRRHPLDRLAGWVAARGDRIWPAAEAARCHHLQAGQRTAIWPKWIRRPLAQPMGQGPAGGWKMAATGTPMSPIGAMC